jgi:hypothetical protein
MWHEHEGDVGSALGNLRYAETYQRHRGRRGRKTGSAAKFFIDHSLSGGRRQRGGIPTALGGEGAREARFD